MDNKKNKYELEKIPIRNDVKKRIKSKKTSDIAAIDLLHIIGRMMSMQDDAYDEQFDNVFKYLNEIINKIDVLNDCITELKNELNITKSDVEELQSNVA